MLMKLALSIRVASAAGVSAAVAGDEGTVRFLRTIVRDYTTIDHAGTQVTGGSLKGVVAVIDASDGPSLRESASPRPASSRRRLPDGTSRWKLPERSRVHREIRGTRCRDATTAISRPVAGSLLGSSRDGVGSGKDGTRTRGPGVRPAKLSRAPDYRKGSTTLRNGNR